MASIKSFVKKLNVFQYVRLPEERCKKHPEYNEEHCPVCSSESDAHLRNKEGVY